MNLDGWVVLSICPACWNLSELPLTPKRDLMNENQLEIFVGKQRKKKSTRPSIKRNKNKRNPYAIPRRRRRRRREEEKRRAYQMVSARKYAMMYLLLKVRRSSCLVRSSESLNHRTGIKRK